MTAYNLAHVWDDNGVEHVEYIVPKAVWRMGYAMVTDQEPTADFIASEPVPEGSTTLYPLRNPVSEDLLVQYSITSPGSVTLEMYDVGGRLVMTAPQGLQQAGRRSATLSRADGLAGRLPAGVYWVRLRAENSSQARRIVLLN